MKTKKRSTPLSKIPSLLHKAYIHDIKTYYKNTTNKMFNDAIILLVNKTIESVVNKEKK